MTRTISIITATAGAALLFAVPAYGDRWGADSAQPAGPEQARVSPDLEDRAIAAEQNRLEVMLDAREQSLGAGAGTGKASALDAREKSFLTRQVATPAPDWFERAAEAAIRDNRPPVVDDRFTIDPTSGPGTVTVSSGRELEWPQIGFGFGLGLVLVLGLGLVLKARHTRPFAH